MKTKMADLLVSKGCLLVAVGLRELAAARVANTTETRGHRVVIFARAVNGQARFERDGDEDVQDILVDGRLFQRTQIPA